MTTIDTLYPHWETNSSTPAKALEKPKLTKVRIRYKKPSTVLTVHLKPSLFEELKKTSEYLGNPSGFDFSMSTIARRALERYSDHVQGLCYESARAESIRLFNDYR